MRLLKPTRLGDGTMNLTFSLRTAAFFCLVGGLLAGLHAPSAEAVVQDIRAQFLPDPTNPMLNKFVNKTPPSGLCTTYMKDRCNALGIFSLRIPGLTFETQRTIDADHVDPRQGVMFAMPTNWRDVVVVDAAGESEIVQIRIAGIGGSWNMSWPPGLAGWARGGVSGPNNWRNAPAPCASAGFVLNGNAFAQFFWLMPEGIGACAITPSISIDHFRYSGFDYVYELRTPNPLTMRTGQYRGTLVYGIGNGMDIDVGDVLIPSFDSLTLNFTLDVMHALKVEVPPGGNRIELLPPGGWQAWLHQGRKPVRLFRDQTFHVSSSSRFKMQLECQYVVGNTCALRAADSTDLVPLNTSVTLPNGLTDAAGQALQRRPLRLDGSGTELIQPGFYLDRKPAALHFEIAREHVETMLREGVSNTWSGDVTVIWDSEV
jgi:hypothetical protein